jgi:putative transposase
MKLKHYDHDGRVRFVTFCTHKRSPVLTNSIFRKIVLETIDKVWTEYYLTLLAYVIMPEHLHLVVVPPIESKLGLIVGELKRISAKNIHAHLISNNSPLLDKLSAMRNGIQKFALWQRRCYDHNIVTGESIWEKVNYCHNNPVIRGLVKSPDDWEWSSYRWYSGRRDSGIEIDIE